MRILNQRVLQVALATLLLSSVAEGQRPSLGPQFGFATNNLDFFLGAQASLPVTNQVDISPSLDIYFPGQNVTAWALNADLRYWPRLNTPNPGLYVGGGLSFTHRSFDTPGGRVSNSDGGLGLLGGWEFKAVSWRPFLQLRLVLGDADRIEFASGVNFGL